VTDALRPPIFILGSPRSGTGVLYQLLRLHPALAWTTPVTQRVWAEDRFPFERPALAPLLDRLTAWLPRRWLPRPYRGPHDGSLRIPDVPETSEAHAIWNRYLPETPHHVATEADVTPEARRTFRRIVRWHCAYFDADRFLNKTPRHALRIRYLYTVFPNAHFVHLVRDGRDVAASILKRRRRRGSAARWWGLRPPGWSNMQDTASPIVQCGWQWAESVTRADRDARTVVPPERYHVVRYADLTEHPRPTLTDLLERLNLAADAFFAASAPYLNRLENRNGRWRRRLSDEQQHRLHDQIADTLRTWGFID
jgi:hypothetical protein